MDVSSQKQLHSVMDKLVSNFLTMKNFLKLKRNLGKKLKKLKKLRKSRLSRKMKVNFELYLIIILNI